MNETIQVIKSPGYPNAYPSDVRCRWQIRAEESWLNYQVFVHFKDFEIGNSLNCDNDSLEISDKEVCIIFTQFDKIKISFMYNFKYYLLCYFTFRIDASYQKGSERTTCKVVPELIQFLCLR